MPKVPDVMRKRYDFSKAKRNPYARRLSKQVILILGEPTIAYFKEMERETRLPYQTLMNLYLRDCAASGRRLDTRWTEEGSKSD